LGNDLVTTATTNPPTANQPVQWEAEVGNLLTELSDVQTALLEVLQRKRDCLAAVDVQGLAELQPKEEELLARLETCQRRRQAILAAAAAEGTSAGSLGKLARSKSDHERGKLVEQVKSSGARMRLLQHHSLANWVLAQRCLLHVSQLLEIIATGGRMQPTYGDKESVHARGALVNHQA
jgi:hypothetical protein